MEATMNATETHAWLTREWVMAGKATLTVSNPCGDHYTYRICKVESEDRPAAFFVKLLTGPDNDQDYSYVGMLLAASGNVVLTRASKLTDDATAVKLARWVLRRVWAGTLALPDGYAIGHSGLCGACGRTLTTPASIELGLGPVCAERLGPPQAV